MGFRSCSGTKRGLGGVEPRQADPGGRVSEKGSTGMTDTIRVLWVDDSSDIIRAYTKLMARTPGLEVVGTLASADDLLAESARLSPDVVVLDLTMPGKDPLSALTELVSAQPTVKTIVFSGYDDDATVREAADAGAWGLVPKLKDGLPGDVVGAIQCVCRGETSFPGLVAARRA